MMPSKFWFLIPGPIIEELITFEFPPQPPPPQEKRFRLKGKQAPSGWYKFPPQPLALRRHAAPASRIPACDGSRLGMVERGGRGGGHMPPNRHRMSTHAAI